MYRRITRTLYPVIIFVTGNILTFMNTVFNRPVHNGSTARAVAFYQASTPTPIPEAVSRGGSTDAIMLMGVVIVIIVLLPILLRRGFWTK
jgi:hypothetical protein